MSTVALYHKVYACCARWFTNLHVTTQVAAGVAASATAAASELTHQNKMTIYVRMTNIKQFNTFCQVELQVWLSLWRDWIAWTRVCASPCLILVGTK